MGSCSRGLLIASLLAVITGIVCESKLQILPAMERQTKPIGKSVLLTCKSDFKDITEIQWHDTTGKVIPVAAEAQRPPMYTELLPGNVLVLIISSLREIDAGNYICTAMYANTEKLSKTVDIQTIEAITWEDAPVEQHPILGQDYMIRCKVTAKPSPIVDWLHNGEILSSSNTDRYVLAANGLLLPKATEADDGVYTCRAIVMETGELQERNIKVEVYTPPTFKEMETVTNATEDEIASLVCHANGKPNPTFKWVQTRTQMDLSSAGRFSVDAVTGILTIAPAKREDQGAYKCIAKNNAGIVEKSVQLHVVVRPKVARIQNVSIPMGKDKDGNFYEAKLKCIASGSPLPTVVFRKLSSDADFHMGVQPTDDRIVVENSQNQETQETEGLLIIRNIVRSDDGLYSCIAKNKGGVDKTNGHLTVEFPPSFANTPRKEAWSWENNLVNITCLAEGIPNATITWKLNDRLIERDPRFKKIGEGPESVLQVTPNTPQLYGAYKCVATNLHGVAEHEIQLKEAKVPGDIMQAKADVVTATTITFSFVGPRNGGGLPTKAYAVQYWEERETSNEAKKNRTWPIDSSYILENLEPHKRYFFHFAAQNDVGFGRWAAQLDRLMPKRSTPEEPHILNSAPPGGVVISPYADQFELRWQIPADNGEIIDNYAIKICPVTQSEGKWREKDNACRTQTLSSTEHSTAYMLKNLEADTYYKLELRAHNLIGFSSPGQVTVKTVQDPGKAGIYPEGSHNTASTVFRLGWSALMLPIFHIFSFFLFRNSH